MNKYERFINTHASNICFILSLSIWHMSDGRDKIQQQQGIYLRNIKVMNKFCRILIKKMIPSTVEPR
jgi:hypothetical protein